MTGRSVDWSTIGAPSQFDLLNDYLQPKGGAQEPALNKELQAAKPKSSEQAEAAKDIPLPADYVGGVWNWAAEGDKQTNRGYFVLTDNGKEVMGYSVMETAFRAPEAQEIKSYGTMTFLSGKKSKDKEGRLHLKFKLSGNDPMVLSEAVFSPDLERMKGESTVSASNASGPKKLSYRWLAQRRR